MRTKTQLHQEFIHLKINKKLSPQKRGYEFERLLYQLFEIEQLQPAQSFRTKGEQIDGMFKHEVFYYLLEARWIKEPISASQLLSFAGKVIGKFESTRGVFMSMSGFSQDAPNALRYLPSTNILLFDKVDIEYCFDPRYSFAEILNVKLRSAAQLGRINYSFKQFLSK